MKERVIIVLVAVIFGLAATTLGYFIYQSAKDLPNDSSPKTSQVKLTQPSPTPINNNGLFLTMNSPQDNSLTVNRTVQVKGKTNANNTIIVSTNSSDIVATPSSEGDFAVTITIDAGTNRLITRAISPNGEEISDSRIISFNTGDF